MATKKSAGKSRRSVRCTLCTPFRWMGNAAGRFKSKDEMEMKDIERLKEIKWNEDKQK